jgi:hypothetical protein
MMQTIQIWSENISSVAYVLVMWWLIIAMIRRRPYLPQAEQRLARLFIWGLAILVLGDTGHVGFRTFGYLTGDLGRTIPIFGTRFTLVGLGLFTTSFTITLFYVAMLMIWRERFNGRYGWLGIVLFCVAVVRIVFILLPINEWYSIAAPRPWAIYRNIPLVVLGLGVAYLILRDARAAADRTFTWIGVTILFSYACYVPVVLFVDDVPVLGMLMIFKSLAYVVIAWIAYANVFREAR